MSFISMYVGWNEWGSQVVMEYFDNCHIEMMKEVNYLGIYEMFS
jgi:hypothetical protein